VTIQGLLIGGDATATGTAVYSSADANVFYGITNGNTAGGLRLSFSIGASPAEKDRTAIK